MPWTGLSASQANRLRVRCGSATLRATKWYPEKDGARWEGGLGLAVADALKPLRDWGCPRLTDKEIIQAVNDIGFDRTAIRPNQFGEFQIGEPSGNVEWARATQYILSFIYCGENGIKARKEGRSARDPNDDAVPHEGDRARQATLDHLFGPDLDESRPPFFARKRWTYGSPFDLREFQHELRWPAVNALLAPNERDGGPGRIVFVSGGQNFPHRQHAELVSELVDLTNAGVNVEFVYAPGTQAEAGFDSLKRDFPGNPEKLTGHPAPLDQPGWLHPTLRFVYFDVAVRKRAPFLLQYHLETEDTGKTDPLTRIMTAADMASFVEWLGSIRGADSERSSTRAARNGEPMRDESLPRNETPADLRNKTRKKKA